MLPPNTTSRPSAVKVWPAHQMLAGFELTVARIAPQRRIDPLGVTGGGIPEPRLRGIGVVYPLAAVAGRRVFRIGEPHHPSGRQHRCVDSHHRNRERRTPTTPDRGVHRGNSTDARGARTRRPVGRRQAPSPLSTPHARVLCRVPRSQHRPLKRTQLALTDAGYAQLSAGVIRPRGSDADCQSHEKGREREPGS